jgi:hypothetical protein
MQAADIMQCNAMQWRCERDNNMNLYYVVKWVNRTGIIATSIRDLIAMRVMFYKLTASVQVPGKKTTLLPLV